MACTDLFLTRPCLLISKIMIFSSAPIKMMQSARVYMCVHTEIQTTPKNKKLSL